MGEQRKEQIKRLDALPGLTIHPSVSVTKEAKAHAARFVKSQEPFVFDWVAATHAEAAGFAFAFLELPNDVMGYHFHLLSAVSGLWARRKHDSAVFALVEELALIDAQLVRLRPDAFKISSMGGSQSGYVRVPSLDTLATLYANEADWLAAESVVVLATTIENTVPRQARILERAAALKEEALNAD